MDVKNHQNPIKKLVVFVGLIKLDNLALIVEKLNELGAYAIVPFTSANSNVPKRGVSTDRLETIAIQSCKQCTRSTPLKIVEPVSFDEMIRDFEKFDIVLYADRGEHSVHISNVDFFKTAEHVAVIIGPEGGLTLEENLALTELATPITLGKRKLRSETAAIAASALILSKLGEI
jgi:16S rRNA (uracil1498-N3)-methyltransferase